MSDNLVDACKNLRHGLDKVKVNRSHADNGLRPSDPGDFKRIMAFTLYVSLRAVVNSRKLAFHVLIAQFFFVG